MRLPVSGLLAVAVLAGTSGHASGASAAAPEVAREIRADTVRVGSPALRPRLLAPGTHTIRSYKLEDGIETLISRTTQRVEVAEQDGEEVYRVRTVHESTSDTTRTLTVVRRRDLALLQQDVRASHDSATVTVIGLHLTGWSALPKEPVRQLDRELEQPVLPLEGQMPWLMGLLPLGEGYVAMIPQYSPWTGEEIWRRIEVLDSERVRVGGSEVDCWRVDAGSLGPPGYRATRWIDKRTRRVLQSALRGEVGATAYWSVTATPE